MQDHKRGTKTRKKEKGSHQATIGEAIELFLVVKRTFSLAYFPKAFVGLEREREREIYI